MDIGRPVDAHLGVRETDHFVREIFRGIAEEDASMRCRYYYCFWFWFLLHRLGVFIAFLYSSKVRMT